MDYINEIYCISLDKSKKRRDFFISKIPSNIPYKFMIVKKHKKGGVYGCFHSHLKIIKDVYKRGLDNVLIFEDDAYPTSSFTNKNIEEAIHFLKTNEDWECFYLGYLIAGLYNSNIFHLFSERINSNIFKFNPLGTHAYILNRKGMEKILNTYKNFIGICHYDIYLAKYIKLKNYCFMPMLFDQNYYLEYNVEPLNNFEYILRKLYPFWNFIKINYYSSIITYNRSFIIIILLLLFYRYGRTRI